MDHCLPRSQDPETAALLARLLDNPRGVMDLAGALRQLALALEAMASVPSPAPQRPRPGWYQP